MGVYLPRQSQLLSWQLQLSLQPTWLLQLLALMQQPQLQWLVLTLQLQLRYLLLQLSVPLLQQQLLLQQCQVSWNKQNLWREFSISDCCAYPIQITNVNNAMPTLDNWNCNGTITFTCILTSSTDGFVSAGVEAISYPSNRTTIVSNARLFLIMNEISDFSRLGEQYNSPLWQ